MNLRLKDIILAYNAIKKRAFLEYEKGNYDKCLLYIDNAVVLSSQIMWKYSDNEFEDLLMNISQKIIVGKKENYQSKDNRVVFYDAFGLTYILAIQYINALLALGKDILYIYEEREHQHKKLVPVVDLFKKYPNLKIEIITSKKKTEKIQEIYETITNFQPSKVFIHIDTYSAVIPVLYSLPSEITSYFINLGDHTFWLGTKGIDYTFEFRSFGAVVSNEKRGISKDQTILLPYYPIVDNKEFIGFPKETRNKVIIFSGGDIYKTIDKDNTYWELVKSVLNENPNAVVLFACKLTNNEGPKILKKFIQDNHFEQRFINIGFRPDINEVFKNCDIFMGTCPMSGGLMSQYAAVNSKPILQYYPANRFPDNETESVICYNDKIDISYTDKKSFLKEAKRLIDNVTYRTEKGEKIKSCMITEDQFNKLFAKSIETHITPVEIEYVKVHYDALTNWWIEIGNKGYYDASAFIYEVLGIGGLFEVPKIISTYLFKRYIIGKVLDINRYKSILSNKNDISTISETN